eukprot:439555-Hanusia_phi.AAC.2
MSKMRLEEQMKYSQLLEQTRADLEHEYQKKLEAIRTREAEVSAKSMQREKELEQQFYHHRQRMLSDLEDIRRREGELRKEEEFSRMRMAKSESRCKELEHALELKLAEVEKSRMENERKRGEEVARERSEMKRKSEEEEKRLREGRKELDEQKLQLKMAEDAFGTAMNEARLAREECLTLQSESESLKMRLEKTKREAKDLSDANAELREELTERRSTCERLQERILELQEEGKRGEKIKEASQSYEAISSQLEEMRSSFSRERLLKEKHALQLESQLKSARSEIISLQHQLSSLQRDNDELQVSLNDKEEELLCSRKELGESRLRMKVLEEEISDCKKLLWQTQSALDRDRQRLSDSALAEKTLLSSKARPPPSYEAPDVEPQPARTRTMDRSWQEDRLGRRAEEKEDAWEFDMNRILSVINNLDHENEVLRKNRELYLAERRREKLLRSFESPASQPLKGWTDTSKRREVEKEEERARHAAESVSARADMFVLRMTGTQFKSSVANVRKDDKIGHLHEVWSLGLCLRDLTASRSNRVTERQSLCK